MDRDRPYGFWRVIRADYDQCSVISLYLPSGTNVDRLTHKFKFMDDFKAYIDTLKKISPNSLCGDYNICHQAIDIHDPVRIKMSRFSPEERAWLDGFLKSGFIDSFRHLNPDPHHYSWWSYRANARANNKAGALTMPWWANPWENKSPGPIFYPKPTILTIALWWWN